MDIFSFLYNDIFYPDSSSRDAQLELNCSRSGPCYNAPSLNRRVSDVHELPENVITVILSSCLVNSISVSMAMGEATECLAQQINIK